MEGGEEGSEGTPSGRATLSGLMTDLRRITVHLDVMGGRPCIRGMRVTVGAILGLLAAGRSAEEIVQVYPYLEAEDIREALAYAAWRLQEREPPEDRAPRGSRAAV